MNLIRKIWNNFKEQPDVWFFYGFLATFTLSIRKVLLFYPILGQFNEYSGTYLYLSDPFLFLAILTWLISILQNKQTTLSIKNSLNVPRGTILLPFFLVLWSFISISWSNHPIIAFFRSIKLFEFYLLYLFIIIQIVPRGTILRNSLKVIITIGTIQSIIGIWQFSLQHSIGLFWLKESFISPEMPGVANLIFNNAKTIRAYGLFPHPNILGGFLLLSIISTLIYKKMFHVEQLATEGDIKCSTWNNSRCETYKPNINVPRGTFINFWHKLLKQNRALNLAILIQVIAFILTFSKSAIIGLFLAFLYPQLKTIAQYLCYKLFHVEQLATGSAIKCSTWNNSRCEIYEPVKNVPRGTIAAKKWILLFFIAIISIYLTNPDFNSLLFKSLDERLLYINVSRGTISNNPILGLGAGQFITNMQNHTNQTLLNWQFQPVHNVFLLIWSELGLIGLLIFLFMLWKLFHVEQLATEGDIKCSTWNNSRCETYKPNINVPRGTFFHQAELKLAMQGILFGYIFIMLFDHYLWDIQQGQIIFWLTLALLASSNPKYIDR